MVVTGKLRHRITFQKQNIITNENGFEETIYDNYKTVWTKVSNLSGKEYFEAAKVQKEKTVKFLIRAGIKIDESMRIMFNEKSYNIIFIDNINYKNKYIEVKALEVDQNSQIGT
jgi:SPP1 family predicted phage head-tail adaptor